VELQPQRADPSTQAHRVLRAGHKAGTKNTTDTGMMGAELFQVFDKACKRRLSICTGLLVNAHPVCIHDVVSVDAQELCLALKAGLCFACSVGIISHQAAVTTLEGEHEAAHASKEGRCDH
jgi:hypothetical protein